MKGVYFAGVLFVLGVAQVQSIPTGQQTAEPAFIEDVRQGRIVAGWEAADGQIPHQVSLRMVSNVGAVASCGGSIIHHNWVLTAAHCVANRITFVVRFGLTNVTRPEYIVESTRRHMHPRYIEWFGGVQNDDIALIGIDQHIPYGPYIQPCRLQNSQQKDIDYTGVVLTVSGYGMTDDAWNGGTTSEVLRWVLLRGISNTQCRQFFSSSVVQAQTVCAEYYNETAQSSCQGDSGGPLTEIDEDGQVTMIGVVSFGSSVGCNSRFPTAFVRPGYYHDWYTQVTGLIFDWSSDAKELAGIDAPVIVDSAFDAPIIVGA